jgi:hypothetical protein
MKIDLTKMTEEQEIEQVAIVEDWQRYDASQRDKAVTEAVARDAAAEYWRQHYASQRDSRKCKLGDIVRQAEEQARKNAIGPTGELIARSIQELAAAVNRVADALFRSGGAS